MVTAEMLATRPDGTDRAVARVSAWLLATSDTADAATDRHPPLVEGEAMPNAARLGRRTGLSGDGQLAQAAGRAGDAAVAWLSPLVPWSTTNRSPICSGWPWWSTRPTVSAPRWIPTSSCS